MKKLVVASNNKGKLKEIKEILKGKYEVVSMGEMGFNEEIFEDGNSFYENAKIKAQTVAKALNIDALADDSGLCVDALDGAPGIFSARYSGEHGDDKANRDLLLKNLEGVENRNAKFVSSIVLIRSDGTEVVGLGETFGKIGFKEEDSNGFGYDCIFISDDLGVSFGLASDEDKNKVSHRYRGLIDLLKHLWLK